jgi:hypothetical protein
MGTDAVDSEHQEREHDTFPELRDIENVLQAGKQGLDHLCLSARSLYLFHCALAELMCPHRKFGLQLTHAENLEARLHVLDHAFLQKHIGRHDVNAGGHGSEIVEIYYGILFPEYVRESPFWDAPLQRHLSAFETCSFDASGAGLLAFVTFACGLAAARTNTSSDPLCFLCRPCCGLQFF